MPGLRRAGALSVALCAAGALCRGRVVPWARCPVAALRAVAAELKVTLTVREPARVARPPAVSASPAWGDPG